MTLASDQNLDAEKLSELSKKFLGFREQVFAEWEKRIRLTLKEAGALPHPILINTFPTLYDNIAEALTVAYPRENFGGRSTVASEHGGERARLTNYNPQAVITEYQTLRWTIFDVARQNRLELDDAASMTINIAIDNAITESVTAYALVQSALREQFVAALTHDLRNPLATASAATELIQLTADSPKIQTLAKRISDSLTRMDRMINDLLDAVVFDSGERMRLQVSQFDIAEVVKEVIEQAVNMHGPRFELHEEPVIGWWDRDVIKRVVENLVGNAVKYGEPGTPIRISIQSRHERIALQVHNEGEPIPPEQMECVFQVFRRAEAAKSTRMQGWGIGLPFVRGAAESHGGSVGVDSAQGRGTTFSIDIPIDSRPFQEAPTLEQTDPGTRADGKA